MGNTNTTALAGTIGTTISGNTISFGGDKAITALNAMATTTVGAAGTALQLKPGVGGKSGSARRGCIRHDLSY